MRRLFFILSFLIFFSAMANAQGDFDTSSLTIKASAKLGEVQTKSITITSKASGDFFLNADSAKGASIKENNFTLREGEEKTLILRFDSEGLEPGFYVGSLEIKGPQDSAKIPLIFEVESEDVLFDANIDIPPAYNEVEQGSKLTYQIKIFDLSTNGGTQLGQGAVNVGVNYLVYSSDGRVLITKDDSLLVEKQAQLTSAIGFPSDIAPGSYILAALVKYKDSVGAASQNFEIKEAQPKELKTNIPNYTVIAAVVFALVIFFGTIILFVYLLKERDRAMRELRTLNQKESENIGQLMIEQKEFAKDSGKGLEKEIDKEIEQKLAMLRQKQQDRVEEIQRLKDSGNLKEMEQKLKDWREKGYDTSVMDFKIAHLTNSEMKQLLKKWKKKYKKTSEKTDIS